MVTRLLQLGLVLIVGFSFAFLFFDSKEKEKKTTHEVVINYTELLTYLGKNYSFTKNEVDRIKEEITSFDRDVVELNMLIDSALNQTSISGENRDIVISIKNSIPAVKLSFWFLSYRDLYEN